MDLFKISIWYRKQDKQHIITMPANVSAHLGHLTIVGQMWWHGQKDRSSIKAYLFITPAPVWEQCSYILSGLTSSRRFISTGYGKYFSQLDERVIPCWRYSPLPFTFIHSGKCWSNAFWLMSIRDFSRKWLPP